MTATRAGAELKIAIARSSHVPASSAEQGIGARACADLVSH
jgi:hypothetical protein